MITQHALCFHGHFYQPPRGNPFSDDGVVGVERGAEPFQNFNEKITAECYGPNASLGNFNLMSFNLGGTLASWLQKNAPATYGRVIAADKANVQKWGVGNALAQPAHHAILPLCRRRDKALQIRWGMISFEHRFGRPAEGMWLPEMAVDLETLQVMHDVGLKFTLLSQTQVRGAAEGGGPYWVKLPSGDQMAVYVRDDWHSNQLSFNISNLGGAGRWARNTLAPLRRNYGRLLLLAMDGETFGHHHLGEEHFLHWLLAYEAGSVGYEVTTLARDLRDRPPAPEMQIEINECTAWSCPHGLSRWSIGCDCTPGDHRWKGALRRAFDNLSNQLDEVYVEHVRQNLNIDPWPIRENYLRVRLGQLTESQLLREAKLNKLNAKESQKLLTLLQAQFYRQRMYVSCTFFFEDLDRPEPRYGIANAARAVTLVTQAIGTDLCPSFRTDLALAVSNDGNLNGSQILDEVLTWAEGNGQR